MLEIIEIVFCRIYNDVITLRKGSSYMCVTFATHSDVLMFIQQIGPNYHCPMQYLNQSKYHWSAGSVIALADTNSSS